MSNPGVLYLASADKRTHKSIKRFDIEDNIGEAVHIHYNDFRFDFTIDEFLAFADMCRSCLKSLYQNGVDVSVLPSVVLKEYAKEIGHIQKIAKEAVPFSTLLYVNEYDEKNGLFNIVPLRKTKLYKLLSAKKENGLHQVRFDYVRNAISNKRITLAENHIYLVGTAQIVRHGLYEALGLYMEYGESSDICVNRVSFDTEVSIHPPRCAARKLWKAFGKKMKRTLRKNIF